MSDITEAIARLGKHLMVFADGHYATRCSQPSVVCTSDNFAIIQAGGNEVLRVLPGGDKVSSISFADSLARVLLLSANMHNLSCGSTPKGEVK